MLESFLVPFTAIFLAELLDKSQLTILLLATKTKKHLELLLGVVLAFIIVDGSAVLFGSLIRTLLPDNILRILSGVLFIIFGLLSLHSSRSAEAEKNAHLRNPLFSGFSLVFFSEWGDKTQIASGVFAAKYPPLLVFFGVMCALTLLSVIAILAGSTILAAVKKQTVSVISGILFIFLGIFFLLFR